MITARGLGHRYGPFRALRDVGFQIPRGQIVGLVGPNGAGKTTTMKILTGYLVPSEGVAEIAGHDVVDARIAAQRHIGYLPENAPIYRDMLVQDYLVLMARLREVAPGERLRRISDVVHACSLQGVLTRPVGHLSKGFRQRVGLAQAMVHDPDILILDEPTSGLDPTQILEIREVIRRMGERKTVVLSTHILSEVEATCDRALMIVSGQLHVDEEMSSFRRGHQVRIVIQGRVDDAAARLSNIPGVQRIETLDGMGQDTGFRLHTDARDGLLHALGAAAHQAGYCLVELTREHRDLEDIFKALRPETAA